MGAMRIRRFALVEGCAKGANDELRGTLRTCALRHGTTRRQASLTRPSAGCHSHPSSDGPRDCNASHAVVVHSLREYKGQVANWDRVYAADESITFREA